ncbi:MAG: hypothetical protein PHQ26_07575 [Bacteroidales bacterium]|jgi:hypothetical protein|nr:hypothetical protein [Bacteroidales bacterium]HKL93246.1 hypothetical protein [Bacteroidales bacterium]
MASLAFFAASAIVSAQGESKKAECPKQKTECCKAETEKKSDCTKTKKVEESKKVSKK